MSWTKEQEEMLMMLVKEGRDADSVSDEMIANGFENRSPRSVKAKHRSMTGQPWPTGSVDVDSNVDVEQVVLEEIKVHLEEKKVKSNLGKYVLIGCLIAAMGIVGYWWLY